VIEAVVFDLDGVLVDSEQAWDGARRELVEERGGTWTEGAEIDMLGMSSREWPVYLRDRLGVDMQPADISADVVARMLAGYRKRLPLIPGAVEAVERMAARWPLGLASSSNREVIDVVLEQAAIARQFRATVSSEEVARGKPSPDVFLEAARRLGVDPAGCAAIEDSHNGILSASAAGMRVIALPNHAFPPGPEALGQAHAVLGALDELIPARVDG
jgi:HAD superfamily hydrolase (TIGR01509 family)